jgi:hypothetical protein
MKKILLITLFLMLVSSFLVANEISFYYSSKRIDKGVGSERFWHLKDFYLEWEGNNFITSLDFSGLMENNPKLSINEAWIKFNLFTSYYSFFQKYKWFTIDMTVGDMHYPFGNVSSRSSKNISIFHPQTFDSNWMVNFTGELCSKYTFKAYWADGGTNEGIDGADWPSTIGFRGKYSWAGLGVGGSFRIRDWDNSDRKYDWGADLLYELGNIAKLNLQVFNISDDDDNSDLNFFLITSYEKGFILPFAKKTIPYLGYFSRNGIDGKGSKESNIVIGLNMKPVDNSFVKFEYNIDSAVGVKNLPEDNQNITNALSFEVGFMF